MGLVVKDDGWRMPEWLWERIEPLLPQPEDKHPLGCHRPRVPNRAAMDAILLVLRTGMQWNALAPDAFLRLKTDPQFMVKLLVWKNVPI